MRWENTETPTFAGSNGTAASGPDVVEAMQLVDRNGSVVATFAKSVAGALSLDVDGGVSSGLIAYKAADTARNQDNAPAQVETATVAGGPVVSQAQIVVTAAGMPNSAKTVKFSVAQGDDAAAVATKARAALTADTDVSGFFTVSGATDKVILTAKTKAADDATMNMASSNDTSSGLTTAANSANTTAGAAAVLQVETATVAEDVPGTLTAGDATVIVTAAGMANSPKSVTVALATNDPVNTVATKIRAALTADVDVIAFFTVGGSNQFVALTARAAAANDTLMNIDIDNATVGGSVGLTTAHTSADTTAGVLGVLQVETATIIVATVMSVKCTVIVTADGMTNSAKTFQVTVAAGDTAAQVAGKIRAVLTADVDVSAWFTVGGTGAIITLTVLVDDDYDSTMNLATDNGAGCSGLSTAATSVDTTLMIVDSDLSLDLPLGTFLIEGQLPLTTVDGGFKCDFAGGTVTAENFVCTYTLVASDGTGYDFARGVALGTAGAVVAEADNDDYVLQISGSIEVGTPGTLVFEWGPKIDDASDTTVLRGGWLRATQI